MTALQAFEQQFNFTYPEIYHRLYADKMLEYGTAGPNWFATTFASIRQSPPLLLFANDYEFISVEDLGEFIKSFVSYDDYWRVDPALQLIPFAGDGVGDIYCFYFAEQNETGVPIVLLEHDSDDIIIKAKNLQDFIFKMLLEMANDIQPDSLLRSGNAEENITAMLTTHKKYLQPQQAIIIDGIFNRPFVNKNLLPTDELTRILATMVGEERTFVRNNPGG